MMLPVLVLLTVIVLAMSALLYMQHIELTSLKMQMRQTTNDMMAMQCGKLSMESSYPSGAYPSGACPSSSYKNGACSNQDFMNNLFCNSNDNDLPDLVCMDRDKDRDCDKNNDGCSYDDNYSSYEDETKDEVTTKTDDVAAADVVAADVVAADDVVAAADAVVADDTSKVSKKKLPNELAKNFDEGHEVTSSNDNKNYSVYVAKNGVKRWRIVK
jgi:hypothetical protein